MAERTKRATAVVALLLSAAGCPAGAPPEAPVSLAEMRAIPVPAEHRLSEAVYDLHCASCHGEKALGTDLGPPLVHPVYRPAHHSDYAFQLAIRQGVRAHHWRFGDMPPVPGMEEEQGVAIIAYLRWLQRQAGIE
jgi:hypothetical protein